MSGRIAIVGILLTALAAGIAMYYLQVFAFYEDVSRDLEDVQLTSLVTGEPAPVMFENYQGIDSDSSPIRYRSCFDLIGSQAMLTETYAIHPDPVPLNAPGWFDCFDAAALAAQLEAGEAIAFMGVENIRYGIDRVVAVRPDGSAFAWNQINACGEVVFGGDPAPEGCPEPPESLR